MKNKNILWFSEVDKEDGAHVGGKGANLGEMTKAGFPVPDGFIVTSHAYYEFLDETKLRAKIHDQLANLDVSDSKKLDLVSNAIYKLIIRADFPSDLARDILKAYFQMDTGLLRHALVAVRSSATAEDLPGASFAGQQATFLNVYGEANLIEKVKEAWASLFTPRAIFYRATNNFDHMKVGIAVPVQRMVQSEYSGVLFTIDPVTNDKAHIVIEAILGLGEMIVQGAVTPDHYVVLKKEMKIIEKEVNRQEKMMLKKGKETVTISVPKEKAERQKISDELILKIAKLGIKLEQHYYFPQDVEWAIEKEVVYIVQTRPVTTTGKQVTGDKRQDISNKELLLTGDAASPGIASGSVKILTSAKEIHKVIPGDVLVSEMTNPDFVPAMKKARAIVTERGGRTSHAAIVSRELGIPAVVGAKDAMKILKVGQIITVNGTTGEVFKGAISNPHSQISMTKEAPRKNLKTATKVYVNLAEPSRAREISKYNVDGVGLLRAEFMIAGIGTHPKKLIKERKQNVFVSTLSEQLGDFCRSFESKPVVYRATDFRTNEYRNLKGGEEFEPVEPNPMLGFRGAARYVADPQVFELELEAIKIVRNKMKLTNLWLMVPFVRNPKELLEVKKIVSAGGLSRSSSFQLWMMVEIPTNVLRLEDFISVGIDGISIGSNDLTMLTLGTDRDNSDVAHDFSELDPSMLWMFEKTIKTCHAHGITSSMCGQAPSDYPELVEKLVSWGITSVSVNPDAVDNVRNTIFEAEKKS